MLVYYDNISIVYISSNPVQQRNKHIEIGRRFIREQVALGYVHILHVLTSNDVSVRKHIYQRVDNFYLHVVSFQSQIRLIDTVTVGGCYTTINGVCVYGMDMCQIWLVVPCTC
jgi:hypothetical protein